MERERSRIARDLHDDLGSSLARISLLSGLVKADKDNPAQVETHAGKIFDRPTQTVRALEEIVWAVRPGSDTLQSLVEYIAISQMNCSMATRFAAAWIFPTIYRRCLCRRMCATTYF